MKVFVVGTGATGSVLVNTLAKRREVDEIYCVSKTKSRAKQFIRPGAKIKFFAQDLGDQKKIEKLARGSHLVINAASPWLNPEILKLALKVRANYQDLEAYLGFDDGKSRKPYHLEYLAFAKEFKKRKLLALFDAGAAPGLTNLLVAHAFDKFGPLNAVKIRLLEDIQSSVIISTWSPRAAIDEIYSRPVVYQNGKFILLSRFSDPEEFAFPKPFGKKTTYSIMNNEAFTIPRYIKLRRIEVRSAGSDDEAARLMVGLGLLERKPIHLHGATIAPLEFIMKIMPSPPTPQELKSLISHGLLKNGYFAFGIEINHYRKSKIIKFNYWVPFPSQKELFQKRIYSTYIAYPAGLCAAAFALEIPNIKFYGVTPPEGLPQENRESILERIKSFGIKVTRSK